MTVSMAAGRPNPAAAERGAPPTPAVQPDGPVAVLIPVKRFEDAKLRLAPALDAMERAALARRMADRVLLAAGVLAIAVVCDDPDVAAWAEKAGVEVVWTPGLGLNGAVEQGVIHLRQSGFERVVVAHADLPLATAGSLAALPQEGVALVPDRHDDGTNVACVPAASGFKWSYGPGSFARHCAEAIGLGLPLTIVRDPELGWDIDTPADLAGSPR